MMDNKETLNMINDATKNTFDSLRQLGELQLNTWNQIVDKQQSMFNSAVKSSIAQGELLKDAKNIQDVTTAQVDLNSKLVEDMTLQSRQSVEIIKKAGEDFQKLAEKSIKTATDKVKKAA